VNASQDPPIEGALQEEMRPAATRPRAPDEPLPGSNFVPPIRKHKRTPEEREARKLKRRSKMLVKECVQTALDKAGGFAFFYNLAKSKNGEDRRCFAMIAAKLIPAEIIGSLDASLTVKVIKQVIGEHALIEAPVTSRPMIAAPELREVFADVDA